MTHLSYIAFFQSLKDRLLPIGGGGALCSYFVHSSLVDCSHQVTICMFETMKAEFLYHLKHRAKSHNAVTNLH